jgi:signal transduction histidine kinase
VLNIAFKTVRQFDNADQTHFQAITSLIGGALQHVILLESLEGRVEERNRQLLLANEELQQANAQLQQLDELKNRFISDVSHELRTPLTSLGLYLDLLERRPDRQSHYLNVVRGEVNRLRTLVLNVLKIARYDSGRVTTNLQTICMTDIVLQEVALHRVRAEAVGIQIEVKIDPSSRAIMGDAAQLAEMVTLLLYNAVNYTEQGKIEISLVYMPHSDEMAFSIQDRGIGIPADELGHVFQRFYRGSNASTHAGSGLGLNLAQEIIHLHNGTINLTSVLGKGTTVTVLLPAIQSDALNADATQTPSMTINK